MAKIGITGGLGYIGSKLAQTLMGKGHNVRIIDIKQPAAGEDFPGVDVVSGDILNDSNLERFLDGLDFIYHMAAISDVRDCSNDIKKSLALNVLSTRLIIEKLRGSAIAGLFLPSSIVAVCGELQYIPVDENHPTNPINDYGVLKRSAELFCLAYHKSFRVPIVIGRQSTVYGPSPVMKYDSAVHSFIRKALSGEKIIVFGDGTQKRNFVCIDDLIDGYLKILVKVLGGESILGEVFNLAGNDVITVNELVKKISCMTREATNTEVRVEYKPAPNEVIARELKISLEKSKRYLNFEPTCAIDMGLEKTFAFISKRLKEKEVVWK